MAKMGRLVTISRGAGRIQGIKPRERAEVCAFLRNCIEVNKRITTTMKDSFSWSVFVSLSHPYSFYREDAKNRRFRAEAESVLILCGTFSFGISICARKRLPSTSF